MKRINYLTLAFTAAMLAASCDNSAIEPEGAEGSMQISFSMPSSATRAATVGNEAALNDVQMLLFDASGNLCKYHNFSSQEISDKAATIDHVNAGTYTAYVVANGPGLSSVKNLSEFNSTEIQLTDYNSTASDFVMEGHAGSISVTSGATAEPSVALSRFVSRVAVNKITNNIPAAYGALKVERVFLSNVVNTQNLAGNKAPGNTASYWFNKEGRADETTRNSSHVIDGTTYLASAPELTFANIGQSVSNGSSMTANKYMYAYPNAYTTVPAGFNSTFAAQQSVLVIVASFNGSTYYYPVVLKTAPARNTSYEVSATITGAGSSDPNVPVSSGAIKATITVMNWIDGTTYTETF